MVALASITGRTLVLPPPSRIDHLRQLEFHEGLVYDMEQMRRYIRWESWSPPRLSAAKASAWTLHLNATSDIAIQLHSSEAISAETWYLTAADTRIFHWECLTQDLDSSDRRRAALAVFYGLRFARPFTDATEKVLQRLRVSAGSFHALHLRRGDFVKFRPDTYLRGEKLQQMIDQQLAGARELPLLVASDSVDEEQESLASFVARYPRRVIMPSELDRAFTEINGQLERPITAYGGVPLALVQAVSTMLVCAAAARFVGSRDSTYSMGIMQLRSTLDIEMGENNYSLTVAGFDSSRRNVDGSKVQTSLQHNTCWYKATSWDTLPKHAAAEAKLPVSESDEASVILPAVHRLGRS